METLNKEKSYLIKAGFVLVVILSLYCIALTVSEIKNYNFIGGGATASNTISFDGTGEISAVPDLATVTFTIKEDAKDVKDAQTNVTSKETAILAFLDKSGIAKKDIKTENYNSNPTYQWRQGVCPSPVATSDANYYC